MRILVIPDVHLKPRLFERAGTLLEEGRADMAACLMDIADDWGMQLFVPLYEKTYDAAIGFAKKFPETLWCYGNHDLCYIWDERETGYSSPASHTVCRKMGELENLTRPDGKLAYLHRVDSVIFSHAGLSAEFARKYARECLSDPNAVVRSINSLKRRDMWNDGSPLWLRPHGTAIRMYGEDMGLSQVIGHSPVRELKRERNFISCDVFSTTSCLTPIGPQVFPVIDTVTGEITDTLF